MLCIECSGLMITALCIYDWMLAFFQTVCPGQISWQILPNLASLIRFHPSHQLQWLSPAPKIWEAKWWSGVNNMVTLTKNSLRLQAVQMAQSAIFCNISSYTVNPLIHSVNALGGHEYFITLMLLLFTGYCRGNTVSICMRSRQNSERIGSQLWEYTARLLVSTSPTNQFPRMQRVETIYWGLCGRPTWPSTTIQIFLFFLNL